MANNTPEESIAHGRLALSADGTVAAEAQHKFPVWLQTRLDEQTNTLDGLNQAVDAQEGTRREASRPLQDAYDAGEELVRDVNRQLNALPRTVNEAAARAHYGLTGGVSGRLTHAQVEALLRQFVASGRTPPGGAQLRADTLQEIRATLTAIDTHKAGAQSGARQEQVAARDTAFDALEETLSRIWHFLSATLPEGVFDGLLQNYGFTPRQPPERAVAPPAPAPVPVLP
jgi:hypothetical protein